MIESLVWEGILATIVLVGFVLIIREEEKGG